MRTDSAAWLTACAAPLLVAIAWLWPILIGGLYTHSDLGHFHLPIRYFFAQTLAAGDSAAWWPALYGGFHLQGEGQAMLSHPLNRLGYGWLPFTAAFNFELVRSYAIMLGGVFLLLRRLGVRREAALFGALLVSFGSFPVRHLMHMNFVGAAAHLPWLLVAQERLLRGEPGRGLRLAWIALSLLLASQLLHAHPQIVWISLVALALHAVWRLGPAFARPRSAERVRLALARAGALGLAVALGFVSASVQLLPMWEALGRSFRAAPTPAFLDAFALPALSTLTLVTPHVYEIGKGWSDLTIDPGLYCGAATPVLIVWCLLRRRALAEAWPVARAGLVLAGIGWLLALGSDGLLHHGIRLLPVVGLFRAPARFAMLVELGLVVAAAVAFTDLLRGQRRSALRASEQTWLLLPAALGIVATPLLVAIPQQIAGQRVPVTQTLGWLWSGPALAIAAAVLVILAAGGRRWACVLLLGLSVVDLGAYASRTLRRDEVVALDELTTPIAASRTRPGLRLAYGPWHWTMSGTRFAGGYSALIPQRALPAGARRPPAGIAPEALLASYRVASVERAGSLRVPDPLPRARLVTEARTHQGLLDAMARIDVADVALVEQPLELEDGPRGAAEIVEDRPGRIRLWTEAPTRQLLVLSESHHPGWQVRVDGDEQPLVRVYHDFMGCVVPAGRHEIAFDFAPASERWGRMLTTTGLVLTFALPLLQAWRPRHDSNVRHPV